MDLLLDTHALLWWLTADAQLGPQASAAIQHSSNRVYVSAVSAWEIAIKAATRKLQLPDPPPQYVTSRIAQNGFEPLPILLSHALHTYTLPPLHRDPFDRILIAQSQVESLPLLTADTQIMQYAVQVLW